MKPDRLRLILALSVCVVVALALYAWKGRLNSSEVVLGAVPDVYLQPVLDQGSPIRALPGYYQSHPLARGDLVQYRYSIRQSAVIRFARGIPGDRFHLVHIQEPRRGWALWINDEQVTEANSAEPLIFGSDVPPPLALSETAHAGVIPDGQAIVLSARSPGERDSTVFGLISISDLTAKVER